MYKLILTILLLFSTCHAEELPTKVEKILKSSRQVNLYVIEGDKMRTILNWGEGDTIGSLVTNPSKGATRGYFFRAIYKNGGALAMFFWDLGGKAIPTKDALGDNYSFAELFYYCHSYIQNAERDKLNLKVSPDTKPLGVAPPKNPQEQKK